MNRTRPYDVTGGYESPLFLYKRYYPERLVPRQNNYLFPTNAVVIKLSDSQRGLAAA